MGLLDFLSGNKPKATMQPSKVAPSRSAPLISFQSGFAEIPSLNFFGQYSKSLSGEWLIAWSDSDEATHRGGYRDSGKGRYVLCNMLQNTVVLEGRIERPNSGAVADNGSFSIEDWHFGDGLSGTFYVFSAAGEALIKKRLKANILNSAISADGRLAICQTANSPDEDDGNSLTAFDIEHQAQLFSVHPSTGWASSYQFDSEGRTIGVVLDGIGTFRYNLNGELLDGSEFEQAKLRSDRYEVALMAAEDVLKQPEITEQLALAALEAGKRACAPGTNCDTSWKAIGFKVQGIAHEFLHNNDDALSAYDEALKLNPKIGVKRKADSLRKKLGHSTK